MAKAKQQKVSGSAAQRREQGRQPRQQESQSTRDQIRRRDRRKRASGRSSWLLVGGIVAIVVVIVGIFIYLSNQSRSASSSSPVALQTITHIDPSLLARVNRGTANNVMKRTKDAPRLTGPTGKPEFFYVGAEYCPFCAAQRWEIIVALSRFGTFGNVSQTTSSELNIPTFTFSKSTYTSQYIDFVSLETADNQGNPLQKPTADQWKLINTYDAPPYTSAGNKGGIPFIDIANQLVSAGSYYQPEILAGRSWDDVANQIKDPSTDIAKNVLGSANYLTAALCLATQNQPANVCVANPIPQMEKLLPRAFHLYEERSVYLPFRPSNKGEASVPRQAHRYRAPTPS